MFLQRQGHRREIASNCTCPLKLCSNLCKRMGHEGWLPHSGRNASGDCHPRGVRLAVQRSFSFFVLSRALLLKAAKDLLLEVQKLNDDPKALGDLCLDVALIKSFFQCSYYQFRFTLVRWKVHAILVQLPLPSHIDEALILSKIRVDKVGLTSDCLVGQQQEIKQVILLRGCGSSCYSSCFCRCASAAFAINVTSCYQR